MHVRPAEHSWFDKQSPFSSITMISQKLSTHWRPDAQRLESRQKSPWSAGKSQVKKLQTKSSSQGWIGSLQNSPTFPGVGAGEEHWERMHVKSSWQFESSKHYSPKSLLAVQKIPWQKYSGWHSKSVRQVSPASPKEKTGSPQASIRHSRPEWHYSLNSHKSPIIPPKQVLSKQRFDKQSSSMIQVSPSSTRYKEQT